MNEVANYIFGQYLDKISIEEIQQLAEKDLKRIDDQILSLRKRRRFFANVLFKIKPYTKQNKLRGSELLKTKGIEK